MCNSHVFYANVIKDTVYFYPGKGLPVTGTVRGVCDGDIDRLIQIKIIFHSHAILGLNGIIN